MNIQRRSLLPNPNGTRILSWVHLSMKRTSRSTHLGGRRSHGTPLCPRSAARRGTPRRRSPCTSRWWATFSETSERRMMTRARPSTKRWNTPSLTTWAKIRNVTLTITVALRSVLLPRCLTRTSPSPQCHVLQRVCFVTSPRPSPTCFLTDPRCWCSLPLPCSAPLIPTSLRLPRWRSPNCRCWKTCLTWSSRPGHLRPPCPLTPLATLSWTKIRLQPWVRALPLLPRPRCPRPRPRHPPCTAPSPPMAIRRATRPPHRRSAWGGPWPRSASSDPRPTTLCIRAASPGALHQCLIRPAGRCRRMGPRWSMPRWTPTAQLQAPPGPGLLQVPWRN